MSTVADKLMTAQEFFEWVHRPENRYRYFELERGEVIEMPPPGKRHGFVCGNIARILGNHTVQRGKGYMCSNDTGVIVEEDPDTVRGSDITLFEDEAEAGHLETSYAAVAPLVAVNVLSPNERMNKVVRVVTELLNRGTKLVWIVDPVARDVCVYRQGREPYVLSEEQELTGDDVLPGFRCRVKDFFALPGHAADTTSAPTPSQQQAQDPTAESRTGK